MRSVNYEALKRNMIYVIKESQIKLGYSRNAVTLNYPVDSLNRFFETSFSEEEMTRALKGFCEYANPGLGEIKISRYEGQFGLTVSAEGVAYVHERVEDSGFLTELIAHITDISERVTIESILEIFKKYSDKIVCEAADNEEFNYVVYFGDGKPDDFIYCFDVHLNHATYHRLTPGDYKALFE